MQVVKLDGMHGNLDGELYLAHAQRQDSIAPGANVTGSFNPAATKTPTNFEDDHRRNCEFTVGQSRVARASCRLSESWYVLGHP